MNIHPQQRLFAAIVVVFGLFALSHFVPLAIGHAAVAVPPKANHHDGKQLLGAKLKTNGHHVIHEKGNYSASVEVKDGKITGVHVKHGKKGDVPVKKYKTNKKMAQAGGVHVTYASLLSPQDQWIYIGYGYYDEYGDEEIYWFPYDMIFDGDTGAIEYVIY